VTVQNTNIEAARPAAAATARKSNKTQNLRLAKLAAAAVLHPESCARYRSCRPPSRTRHKIRAACGRGNSEELPKKAKTLSKWPSEAPIQGFNSFVHCICLIADHGGAAARFEVCAWPACMHCLRVHALPPQRQWSRGLCEDRPPNTLARARRRKRRKRSASGARRAACRTRRPTHRAARRSLHAASPSPTRRSAVRAREP